MRSAKSFARIYGSKARVAWIQAMPSVVSGRTPCVNAHTQSGGMGRKADYHTIVPLTDAEHQELHRIGIKSFEAKYRVDLKALAVKVQERWLTLTLSGERDAKYDFGIPNHADEHSAGASAGHSGEDGPAQERTEGLPRGRGIPCSDSTSCWD